MIETRQVAVMLDLWHTYDRGILQGIGAYVRDHRTWSVVIEEIPHQCIPDLREWRGDGLIVNFDDRVLTEVIRGVELPIVGVGGGSGWHDDRSGIPYVATDDGMIGRMAAEHLIERGLKNFAFCGYPADRINVWDTHRARSFAARLNEDGFACGIFNGHFSSDGALRHWGLMREELANWLRTLPKPVGLMASCDWRARHVLEACRVADLRVPDDVAVIGVDNDPICDLADPPLSSVEQGHYQIGYTAAEVLDRMMSGQPASRQRYSVPPVGLIMRQSTNILAVPDKDVAAALRMIRDHACRQVKAEAVAQSVGLSRSTLDRRFREHIGRTVDEEMRRVRLLRAKELLARTDWTVQRVAHESGFGNEQYLSVVMRKDTLLTPAQYRQSHRTKGMV